MPWVERFIEVFTPSDESIARGDGRLAGEETSSRCAMREGVCGLGTWSNLGGGTAGVVGGFGLGVCVRASWLPGADEGTKGSRSVSTVGYCTYI